MRMSRTLDEAAQRTSLRKQKGRSCRFARISMDSISTDSEGSSAAATRQASRPVPRDWRGSRRTSTPRNPKRPRSIARKPGRSWSGRSMTVSRSLNSRRRATFTWMWPWRSPSINSPSSTPGPTAGRCRHSGGSRRTTASGWGPTLGGVWDFSPGGGRYSGGRPRPTDIMPTWTPGSWTSSSVPFASCSRSVRGAPTGPGYLDGFVGVLTGWLEAVASRRQDLWLLAH